MAAGWRHISAVITGPNVSAVIQSAARLERGRTLGRAGQGRAGVVNVLIIAMPVNGNVTLLWCHLTDKSNVTF